MAYLVLLFGVFCCATSVIFIKESAVDPIFLSSYRLLLGGLFLLPLAFRAKRKKSVPDLMKLLKMTFAPALFLAIHFITWIAGARLTPSANASLLVNMVPIVMPFLLWFYISEKLNRIEILGTFIAMAGMFVIGILDFNLSPEYALGDAICFLSMLFYAIYLIYARKLKELESIYFYVVPVYIVAGLICLTIASGIHLFSKPLLWKGTQGMVEWIPILGLALVPTIFGHSIINHSLKILRGQVVVIINLSQFIFAGVMGFVLLKEAPQLSFYLSSILVIGGALIVIKWGHATVK